VAPSVHLSFNNRKKHGTALGGSCSLFLGLFTVFVGVQSAAYINQSAQYKIAVSDEYLRVDQNTPKLNYTDNADTFPALYIQYRVPHKVSTDPYEYGQSLYSVQFSSLN